jgi:hypothetical protein
MLVDRPIHISNISHIVRVNNKPRPVRVEFLTNAAGEKVCTSCILVYTETVLRTLSPA